MERIHPDGATSMLEQENTALQHPLKHGVHLLPARLCGLSPAHCGCTTSESQSRLGWKKRCHLSFPTNISCSLLGSSEGCGWTHFTEHILNVSWRPLTHNAVVLSLLECVFLCAPTAANALFFNRLFALDTAMWLQPWVPMCSTWEKKQWWLDEHKGSTLLLLTALGNNH